MVDVQRGAKVDACKRALGDDRRAYRGLADQRGVVYLETLIGFMPVFLFFLGTLLIADLSAAHLVVGHASAAAARAAVVVLPDEGIFYDDPSNAQINRFEGYRKLDVEHAADVVLRANPRLNAGVDNVSLDKASYALREPVKAKVQALYRCLVPLFCPDGITLAVETELPYQGHKFKYY